ncbi:hypothetical protein ACFL3M_01765 [Patescibacteria group bacterium]
MAFPVIFKVGFIVAQIIIAYKAGESKGEGRAKEAVRAVLKAQGIPEKYAESIVETLGKGLDGAAGRIRKILEPYFQDFESTAGEVSREAQEIFSEVRKNVGGLFVGLGGLISGSKAEVVAKEEADPKADPEAMSDDVSDDDFSELVDGLMEKLSKFEAGLDIPGKASKAASVAGNFFNKISKAAAEMADELRGDESEPSSEDEDETPQQDDETSEVK